MAETAKPDLAARLAALRQEYLVQLPQKLQVIEGMWAGLADGGWTDAPVRELHRLVHNLTGSGKTFGFAELRDVARECEQLLKKAAGDPVAPDAGARTRMQSAYERLYAVILGLKDVTALPAAGDSARLDQVSDDTASVAVQYSSVCEARFLDGSLRSASQALGAFEPEEVAVRVARPTCDEKRAPTAADLDLQGAVVTEHRVPGYGPENETRLVRWCGPGLLHQLVSENSDARSRHGTCEPRGSFKTSQSALFYWAKKDS